MPATHRSRERAYSLSPRPLAALSVLVLVSGCVPGADEDVDSGTGITTSTATEAPAETPAATGEGGGEEGPRSEVTVNDDRPRSEVELRVAETMSDYSAVETESGETVLTVPDEVLFDFDSAELRGGAAEELDRIAEVLAFHDDGPVEVHGHTDSVGDPDYNQELSERRAQSVVDYLVDAGIDAGRLDAQGFGETRPVADNTRPDGSDDPEGRQQNRRVEILFDAAEDFDVDGGS